MPQLHIIRPTGTGRKRYVIVHIKIVGRFLIRKRTSNTSKMYIRGSK